MMLRRSKRGQAMAPESIPITQKAFDQNDKTEAYWLGSSGIFINSHKTTFMIDPAISTLGGDPPVSEKNNAPYLVLPPIAPSDIKQLDAILYTHADDDHMPHKTALAMLDSGCIYYGTAVVKAKLMTYGVPECRIRVIVPQETYDIFGVKVQCTGAYHPWQRTLPDVFHGWEYKLEDCCGFKLFFKEGILWAPGDSILLAEHLRQTDVDLVFLDVSDARLCYHFGTAAAVQISNTLDKADIIPYHYGTYDLPNHICMNANPGSMKPLIKAPERFRILAPGERFELKNNH